jgi:BirA family transcriptional regulator, biotin operon repressor / biotin---[acetyl-CoA-carboxylase] ligase
MRVASEGDAGKLWIVSAEQTGGRGRHGRVWASPPGNLYASLLLINPGPLERCAELGFVAGVALARAARALAGGDERVALKWPNDLLFAGAKLSGLLLESTRLQDGRLACVIGCGVNCRSFPPGLAYPATHLSAALDRDISPADMFAPLSAAMAQSLAAWAGGAGFATIRADWLMLCHGLGRELRAKLTHQDITGVFKTIDATGRLILDTDQGSVAVEAGDIFPMNISGAQGDVGRRQQTYG